MELKTTPTPVQDIITTVVSSLKQNDTFTPMFYTLSALLLLSLFLLFKLLLAASRSRHVRLPPGPRALPLLGNLLDLDPELHSHFATLAQTHGPIYKLHLGNKLGIVITSPALAREVLKENDVVFANRDVPVAGRVGTQGGHDVVWTPYGPEWRMLRKVCVLKMLSNTTLDSVYGLRRREVRETVGYFYSRVGSEVNVGEQMFLTILNVITSMLWGGTLDGAQERESLGTEFRQAVSEMTDLLGKPNLSDFYPGLARFDLQGVRRQMIGLTQRFNGIFDKMIGQRSLKMKKEREDGGESKSKDFLQFLLELKDEENSNTPFTMVHVKALLMDMVIGGSDTSSNAIEFSMAEIMNQPEIMNKAQQELETVVGKDNIVEESHIHKLPYLQAVMKETLRLHPVLPMLVPHCPSETCTVGGYTVPKGSRVFINVWATQRDPSIWENPLKFDPERFYNNTKWDFSGSDFEYFPFGSGRRICAGIAMAERMVLYSLATFLHSFDWKLPRGEKMDLSEKFGIVLKKKIPLVAIPTPRLSDPTLYE
ncbi:Flavonoid 3'-monooxygenase [Morus notabilis]|uniref:Flavonoid 3'-monooxygenase n=2 Tax=Morus notabilis TaxID=981085 RepID=W9RYQ5_9ROSA|nr:geraniol 8-hydroxylase [Morus notabilis]EXC17882.1 Flavonoid 3'-monooxygenase [Morus notabilis]